MNSGAALGTRERAERFQRMHRGPGILVIANAWDAGSARVFEHAGMQAIGTGSAGIAFSHGCRDDASIDRGLMLAAIRAIVAAVGVPVTADILSGLGETIDEVADTVRQVITMGAVGVNIEDGAEDGAPRLIAIERQVETIRAAAEVARETGIPIVVNARTDSYWLKLGDERERFDISVERARRYREAGADCIFVPGVTDRGVIEALVAAIDAPLNILTVPGCPTVRELQALGVRRVSEGSGPMRATMMLVRRIAEELIATGTFTRFHGDAIPYPDANALFQPRNRR